MLLGMELFSSLLAWTGALTTGQVHQALMFALDQPKVILFLVPLGSTLQGLSQAEMWLPRTRFTPTFLSGIHENSLNILRIP